MLSAMRAPARKVFGLFVVVLACLSTLATLPTPPPPEWAYESAFAFEVGVGSGALEVYEEGDPVPVESGFQGGQHVNASLRTVELEDGAEGMYTAWLVAADGETVIDEPVSFDAVFYADPGRSGGHVYVYGGRVIVEQTDLIIGQDVELRVQVTLSDGRIGRAWHRGVGEWLPEDYYQDACFDAECDPAFDGGVPDDAGR